VNHYQHDDGLAYVYDYALEGCIAHVHVHHVHLQNHETIFRARTRDQRRYVLSDDYWVFGAYEETRDCGLLENKHATTSQHR
jgi:hypothetical protein